MHYNLFLFHSISSQLLDFNQLNDAPRYFMRINQFKHGNPLYETCLCRLLLPHTENSKQVI
uniref:Uncharacterized protein n=1 Tax=Anguilla anguilla TaxID=7936 RepID=A0A0E9W885_ANGAN